MDHENCNTQYGGFVLNLDTGEYDLMFVTELSELLAKNRAIEQAEKKNRAGLHYDPEDYFVKERVVRRQFGEWHEIE